MDRLASATVRTASVAETEASATVRVACVTEGVASVADRLASATETGASMMERVACAADQGAPEGRKFIAGLPRWVAAGGREGAERSICSRRREEADSMVAERFRLLTSSATRGGNEPKIIAQVVTLLRRRNCGDEIAETKLRRRNCGDEIAETKLRRRNCGDEIAETTRTFFSNDLMARRI